MRLRPRGRAVAALAVWTALSLVMAGSASAGALFGFNENWTTPGHDIAASKPFRPTAQRFHLNWALIEGAKGTYDWQTADPAYRRIVDQGAAPIGLVVAAPCWATASATCAPQRIHPVARRNLPDWARFVREAVRRYPALAALEVWNEPNLAAFHHPRPDAESYVETLRHAHGAAKAVRPRLPVLGGSLAPITTRARARRDGGFPRKPTGKSPYGPFLDRMYALGAARYMDGLAFHPYPNFAPYLKGRTARKGVRPGLAAGIRRDIGRQIGTVRRIARRHRAADAVWATETGVCTTGPRERKAGLREQAVAIRETYLTLQRLGARAILMHRLWDIRYPGTPADNIENGCGLTDMRGQRKPAWEVLRRLRAPRAAKRARRARG